MRKILLLICAFGLSLPVLAQTTKASWAALSALQPGQKIQVLDMASTQHAGVFMAVSDTAISYRDGTGDRTIQKPDVRSVKLMENKHRLRNTLIWAGVGAGVGAGIGAGVTERPGSIITDVNRDKGAAVGAVLGVLGGATLGALLPSHSTIYSVGSH